MRSLSTASDGSACWTGTSCAWGQPLFFLNLGAQSVTQCRLHRYDGADCALSLLGHRRRAFGQQLFQRGPALWLGLLAGSSFALCSVCFRGASLALGTDDTDALPRAAVTLAVNLSLQSVAMGAYLLWREPQQIQRVMASWRVAVWVGLIGMTSSGCWFTAMALTNAALVRAMGQIELLFTLITSVWFLGE